MAARKILSCDTLLGWDDIVLNKDGELEDSVLERFAAIKSFEGQTEALEDDAPAAWMTQNVSRCQFRHIKRLPPLRRTDRELAAGINEVEEDLVAWLDGETIQSSN